MNRQWNGKPCYPDRPGEARIAILALAGIVLHLAMCYVAEVTTTFLGLPTDQFPLYVVVVFGGIPLVLTLATKLIHAQFGSDLLAGISIVTAVVLEQYLAGSLVVLMLSGGTAIEAYAIGRASSALAALARRMPSSVHKRVETAVEDIALDRVQCGDMIVVFPHEICPADGIVVEGRGRMDESYLTGEPYELSKAPGSAVLSGAVNGETALTIQVEKLPNDSRYARIMRVMRESEQRRPRLRRLGDQLGAIYTPVALSLALLTWIASGDPVRFLAVLVVATPCPLLIAIPVAVIGSVSLAARRGIIIKDPAVLEVVVTCRTAIFDKTGTLTYGEPELAEILVAARFAESEVLRLVGSLERYSRHPLAGAVLRATKARGLHLSDPIEVKEAPGQGLTGNVDGHVIQVTGRAKLLAQHPEFAVELPSAVDGLECIALIDGRRAGTFRFHDRPRIGGRSFIDHLGARHGFDRVMLVSGDRQSEVQHLADCVGIKEVYASQSPEQKLALVRAETLRTRTVFVGDGINDASALTVATVGIAFGQNSDVTAEAAGAVVLDNSLEKVDEVFHIGARMRRIALQSAVGGMASSLAGMAVAAFGYLPPVAGAVVQEIIDVVAVLNALRAALPPRSLTDFQSD
ncbi:MAG TPA: heavy metal translocating P-type ATPase [Gemmataceae bacterium]|nr:heavy metal translocating P-type ATPase [Gemmataceae bacterium]